MASALQWEATHPDRGVGPRSAGDRPDEGFQIDAMHRPVPLEPAVSGKPAGLPVKADDEFYEQFLAPLESRMLRTVWRIVRDTEMARDTLQDAMATIWKRRDTIRHHPNPEALVLRICINASYDALRKYLHCRQYEQAGIEASFSSIDKPGLASDLSNRELAEEILAAIRRLTRNQAVAVLMRVLQDQPYPVIAQALGCSEPTARIHIMRARGRLSSWLSHLAPSRKRKGGIQ